MKNSAILWVGAPIALSLALFQCGKDGADLSNPQGPSLAESLGAFNFGCDGQSQSKQVQFQQQQGCAAQGPQQKQALQFKKSTVSDFDIDLDCQSNRVLVRNKGADQKLAAIPVQSDGKVKGSMQFQQQVQSDGKGNLSCWIEYIVNFDGKASCDPTSGVNALADRGKTLQIKTRIAFSQTSSQKLQQAGIAGAEPTPAPTPLPSLRPAPIPSAPFPFPMPVPSVLPMPIPSPSVSASPSATPSVLPSEAPSPAASPSLTPVTICVVQDPCPVESDAQMSCPHS